VIRPLPHTGAVRASVFDGRPRECVFVGEVIAIVKALRRGGEVPERQELSAQRAAEASRGDAGSGL
jgi:hypothetical protein